MKKVINGFTVLLRVILYFNNNIWEIKLILFLKINLFLGGFSAGYKNTCGSKEGFVPGTFFSSRN